MCLILFAYQYHPHFPLVLAANRDEFYQRPTQAAAFWEDHPELLAGKDLREGGTWMGITAQGRFAGLTNYRNLKATHPHGKSRGWLVRDFLIQRRSPEQFVHDLAPAASHYNPFNLLVGEFDPQQSHLYYYSNWTQSLQRLQPGIHGLSNHLLDTPWPKVRHGKQQLEQLLKTPSSPPIEALFDLLEHDEVFPDDQLPDTGVGLEMERLLSPVFIQSPTYGTRASTLLFIDWEGTVTFHEKVLHPETREPTYSQYQFRLKSVEDKSG